MKNRMQRKLKILLVDDDLINLKILSVILSEDYELEKVQFGQDALVSVKKFKPDIVLLDIMLPDIDGYEVCQKIKSNLQQRLPKVLLVSARTGLEDRLKGYKAGADDYVVKPFEDEELLAKIQVFSRIVEEENKRKQVEEELRKRELKFRSIFSNANDCIILMDPQGVIVDCNNKTSELLGYSKNSILGKKLIEFTPDIQSDGKKSLDTLSEVFNVSENRKPSQSYQWQLINKDCTILDIETSISLLNIDNEIFFQAIIHNISERKEYEETLKRHVEEMQDYSNTRDLITTVVHNAKKFSTQMTQSLESVIIPLLEKNLIQSDDWVVDLMNSVIETHSNSMQCMDFLESLLSINSKHEDLESISSVSLVKQAISLLSYNLMNENIEWSLDYGPGQNMMIMGNSQLIRVFMNLIANASDALRKFETKDPKIKISIKTADENVVIAIHDNGPGIKPEMLSNIRKGIQISTKGKGGTGFGIIGATKVIKTCRGQIGIESEVGTGTTFIVTLPKAEDVQEEEVNLDGIDLF